MDGWLFAVAVLVAVLGVELVVFRYFADDGPVGETTLASNDVAATGPGHAAPAQATGTGTADDRPARECHNCGTPNDDVTPFLFCRRCLARIH